MELLEQGRIAFATRPRVENAPGIQRFLIVLRPRSGPGRRIAVGKRRMPAPGRREREWAYVDRVGGTLLADLGPSTYETKTRGLRHQPGVRVFAEGTYAVVEHGDHTHLDWALDDAAEADEALHVSPEGSVIVLVFNPVAKWKRDVETAPFAEPSIFPETLQAAFDGKRFGALRPEHLDHEGAELVLTGAKPHRTAIVERAAHVLASTA